jgi:multimeric flavodoxin WrbA
VIAAGQPNLTREGSELNIAKKREGCALKVMAINGSPRKKWNTASLLQKSLEGAASQGAETQLIHLYDLSFKGCVSCFACKTIGGASYGRCAHKDDLTPVLENLPETDVLILGSPIYFGSVTGEMQSFLERLQFPFLPYADPPASLFPGKIRTGFIYTMNVDENMARQFGFDARIALNEFFLKLVFGNSESLCSFDTYQFDDYSKVFASRWDAEKKAKRRAEVFPDDCRCAFEMGKRLTSIG